MKRSNRGHKFFWFLALCAGIWFVRSKFRSNDPRFARIASTLHGVAQKFAPTVGVTVPTPATAPSAGKESVVPVLQPAPDDESPTQQSAAVPPPADESVPDPNAELTPSNLPLKLPSAPRITTRRDAQISELETQNARFPTFAVYEQLAKHNLELGNSAEAARIYRMEAALYRRKGLIDAAQILENRASQNETVTRVFVQRNDAPANFSGAQLEPKTGAYIGAFIDLDDALKVIFPGDNFQYHRFPSEFESRTGRRLGSVFTYVKWGNFPKKWLQMCKEQGVIPQIAWEPNNLNDVRDDQYLRDCAKFLDDLDWPVWVRFAGEMNGDWTPYHGNPQLYKEKFALVHRVLHSGSARVATVWCVNSIPTDNIASYYPGDANCDWVGVNVYSAPYADNDRTREAFRQSPLALLDPIYRKYSARKPIAICEYAASHQAKLDMKMRPDFAIEKMSLLYGALPLLYPRVKMISWFDANNLVHAEPGRQLNNYRLTELPAIQNAFRDLTASPYYLEKFPPTQNDAPQLRELKTNESLKPGERVYLWVTSADARPLVYVETNGKVIYGGRQYGKHVFDLPKNAGSTVILVYDGSGRCVLRREISLSQ